MFIIFFVRTVWREAGRVNDQVIRVDDEVDFPHGVKIIVKRLVICLYNLYPFTLLHELYPKKKGIISLYNIRKEFKYHVVRLVF